MKPIVVFVVANTNAFGLWEGFFLSWLGSAAGSMLMFYAVRRFGQKRAFGFIRRHQTIRRMMLWVERHGFGPLFILLRAMTEKNLPTNQMHSYSPPQIQRAAKTEETLQ
jgi:uncharacterized membrane protein YdjX (TVP38/TMEM64 family)